MTINETYQTLNRIIANLEKALGDDLALSYKNKGKPLNLTVALAVAQLKSLAEGQLPNE